MYVDGRFWSITHNVYKWRSRCLYQVQYIETLLLFDTTCTPKTIHNNYQAFGACGVQLGGRLGLLQAWCKYIVQLHMLAA